MIKMSVDASTVVAAMRQLGETGWYRSADRFESDPDAGDRLRADIRRACRARRITVRTGVTNTGRYVWALTGDGLPTDEPWRGAVVSYRASGLPAEVERAAIDRALGAAMRDEER